MAIPESFLDALTERCDIADVVSRYVPPPHYLTL